MDRKPRQGHAPNGTRFVNHPFRGELSRTRAGSPVLAVHYRDPASCNPSHRRRNEALYEIAIRMERLSDELNARWVISVDTGESRIVVELADEREARAADEVVTKVMEEFSLAARHE